MWTRAPARTSLSIERPPTAAHPMKTTLELPDKLLIAAKTLGAQRKTTLKAMGKSALRREVAPQESLAPDSPCKVGPFGLLSLKKRTEALTGAPVMRLLIGETMSKTARSFPVSHKFPFSPPRSSHADCIASQVEATIRPMTKVVKHRAGKLTFPQPPEK